MSGRCIVCEKTGQWAMALRWAAGNLPLRVHETRSLMDCRQELLQFPASLLVLEATIVNLEGVMQLLNEVHRDFFDARAVVLGDRSLARFEDLLREAGALHVAFSSRRLHLVARMAYRHLPAIVSTDTTLRDEIRMRMPWDPQ